MSMFAHMPEGAFAQAYSDGYTRSMVRKFLFRRGNHWAERLRRVFGLVRKLDVPGRRMLDLGCSIGTMAVEFSREGWSACGVDLDARAVDVAKIIAGKMNLGIEYKVADASDPGAYPAQSFDLIVAGDIIEHLPQPVLEKTLANVRVWLKPGGWFVFHTAPTRFDYIFHKSWLWPPLTLAAALRDSRFTRLVRLYDSVVRAVPGLVRESASERAVHCNLQEPAALRAALERAGLEVIDLETDTFEPRFLGNPLKNILFRNKSAFHRNVLGAAWRSYLAEPDRA